MKNKKQKQSSLYKMKAIATYLKEWIEYKKQTMTFYADDKTYEEYKSPDNKWYGYEVKRVAFNKDLKPLYCYSKAIKIK